MELFARFARICAIAAMVVLTCTACGEKHGGGDTPTNPAKLISSVSAYHGSATAEEVWNFTYNADGKVTNISYRDVGSPEYNDQMTFTYTPNAVTMSTSESSIVLALNDAGAAVSVMYDEDVENALTYTDGYLTQLYEEYDDGDGYSGSNELAFTWESGNLTSIIYTETATYPDDTRGVSSAAAKAVRKDDLFKRATRYAGMSKGATRATESYSSTETCVYGTQINASGNLDVAWLIVMGANLETCVSPGLYGKSAKNLVTGITYLSDDPDYDDEVYTYRYVLDADGRVTGIYETEAGYGEELLYQITYTE